MSCSINKLKSHIFFTCKNFMVADFTWKKRFCSRKLWRGGGEWCSPLTSPPFHTTLLSNFNILHNEINFVIVFGSFFGYHTKNLLIYVFFLFGAHYLFGKSLKVLQLPLHLYILTKWITMQALAIFIRV